MARGDSLVPLSYRLRNTGSPGGGYSVRKLLGVCRGPLKIGPKKIEGKMVFWGQKDRILRGFVLKRSFLCWWMRKNTPKRSCSILPKWKKGVKTAAHMYHPSLRKYPPRDRIAYISAPWGGTRGPIEMILICPWRKENSLLVDIRYNHKPAL